MNQLNFVGNLGNDAEVRYTADGKAITSWSVALKSGFGKSEKTNWVRCSMFGERGTKVSMYLTKGAQVAVSGELSLNEYTNKQGENKASLECNVSNITLLGKRELNEAREQSKANGYQPQKEDLADLTQVEEDIPF
jgi:single-strand DNA-binding protein